MSQAAIKMAIAFRRVAEALELLSEEEVKKLSEPQYSLEIRLVRRRSKDDSASALQETDIAEMIKQLIALPSRQDAQTHLERHFPTRKTLEPIARFLDIPIVKQDKVEALRDKIIEATVGARIRSQAIQGTGG